MNKRFFTFTACIVGATFLLSTADKTQAFSDNGKIYGFKSAEIVLESTGPMNKTTETVQVGEWGKYEKRHTITSIDAFGFKQEQEQITYTNREKNILHNYDPKTNKATALDTSKMDEDFKKNDMYYSLDKESLEKFGGKILREEKYEGLNCTVVEFAEFGSTVWFYKKFPVKNTVTLGGMNMVSELVRFDEKKISIEDLKLPSTAIVGETQDIDSIMNKVNAHKNHPDYQEELSNQERNVRSEYEPNMQQKIDPEEIEKMKKAMEDAGPQIEEAMEALKNLKIFGK